MDLEEFKMLSKNKIWISHFGYVLIAAAACEKNGCKGNQTLMCGRSKLKNSPTPLCVT